MSLVSAIILFFLVLDPVGNVPLFLCSLKNVPPERHLHIIIREASIALGFLLLFLALGKHLLVWLHVSQSSLSIAGGIVLFLIALKMVFSKSEDLFNIDVEGEPFIVPMAIPLIAGPSALATVLLLMAREPEKWLTWLIAILAAWFLSLCILMLSKVLKRILRRRGLTALERLMGLILITVSVEMLINGIRDSFLVSP